MNTDKLFQPGPPAFYMTSIDERAFETLSWQLTANHGEAVIRKIRGRKSETVDAFFDESSAALQFPYYFGENWPAFDECIADLDWLPADAYLLMISNANLLLCKEEGDFPTLIRILSNVSKEWLNPSQYYPRDRLVTPFHILFQCSESDLAAFSKRLADVNATAESL